ncbi:MAG: hypothetical protein C00003105_01492 [ANME-2 cluster archaeon HR1]|nr:MAG: hypothetical protein C00003105_01492 [ANME-2 cluster archaeon HR1]
MEEIVLKLNIKLISFKIKPNKMLKNILNPITKSMLSIRSRLWIFKILRIIKPGINVRMKKPSSCGSIGILNRKMSKRTKLSYTNKTERITNTNFLFSQSFNLNISGILIQSPSLQISM